MTIWFETERRRALITGGSRGIGRGIATHLSQRDRTRTRVGRARVQLAQVHSELGHILAAAERSLAADRTVDASIELHRRRFGSMNAVILARRGRSAEPVETITPGQLKTDVPRSSNHFVLRKSCRAIANVLGVGAATVRRELTRSFPWVVPRISESTVPN